MVPDPYFICSEPQIWLINFFELHDTCGSGELKANLKKNKKLSDSGQGEHEKYATEAGWLRMTKHKLKSGKMKSHSMIP